MYCLWEKLKKNKEWSAKIAYPTIRNDIYEKKAASSLTSFLPS